MIAVQGHVTNARDDISLLQTSFIGRAITDDLCNVNTPFDRQPIDSCCLRVDRLPANAQVGSGEIAVLDDLFGYGFRSIDRDSKAQSFRNIRGLAAASYHQSIDTDHFTS